MIQTINKGTYEMSESCIGHLQDQVGQGSKQPDLVSGVPARCRGVGLDDL